jgi:pre-mRNA-processing factor 6
MGFSTRGDLGPAASSSSSSSSSAGAPGGGGSGLFVDSKFGEAPRGYVAGRGRGMGALAREQGELGVNGGGGSSAKSFRGEASKKDIYSNDPYDQDDDEADRIYAGVDDIMSNRHKRHKSHAEKTDKNGSTTSNSSNGEANSKKAKISDQFVDLKQNLGALSASDWDAIPEVGDNSLKYTQQRRFQNVYVPLPDNIISNTASKLSGGDGQATSDITSQDVSITDSSAALKKARTDGLVGKLDSASDSVSGQTVVDPRGYMTSLDSLSSSGAAELSDIKKARALLRSVTTSNPNHAPGWIAAARVEEVDGKMTASRKIIRQGCAKCPYSEDLWLESARLHPTDEAKSILADAVRSIPTSVLLWMKTATLEGDATDRRRAILRRALEHVPSSIELWKAAVELEPNASDARIMLGRAVECVPGSVDMWLALAKLESYENARKILNQARDALPTERSIWIHAASLEEANHVDTSVINKIVGKMVAFFTQNSVVIDRREWIEEAQRAEAAQSPSVCTAIINHTIGIDVDQQDRMVTWIDDAESVTSSGSVVTARAIYNHALSIFPTKQVLWLGLAALEKDGGSSESLENVLAAALKHCPGAVVLWLMAAKEKWKSSNDVSAARSILQEAVKANPDSEPIWLAAGKLEWESNEHNRARELFASARKNAALGSPKLWMKAALLEQEVGATVSALTLIDEGIKKFPTFYKFYLMAAEYSNTNTAKAIEYLKDGLRRCDNVAAMSIELARLEEHENGPNKARSVLELARIKLPSCPELWLEAFRLERRHANETLADALIVKGQKECSANAGMLWAEDLLTCSKHALKSKSVDALKRCENDPHVVLAIARTFERDGKVDKARKWLQRACQMQPKLGDAWVYYYDFEIKQTALKQSVVGTGSMLHDSTKNSILSEIEEGCQKAEPNRGEVWNSFRKRTKNRRSDHCVILKGIVKTLLTK